MGKGKPVMMVSIGGPRGAESGRAGEAGADRGEHLTGGRGGGEGAGSAHGPRGFGRPSRGTDPQENCRRKPKLP